MSWKATAYVKELRCCPDGAPLTRGQKLLLFVLADYHNSALKMAWPSLPILASDAMVSLAQLKRDLAYLETHYAVERRHSKLGRGFTSHYVFLAIDDPERQNKLLKKTAHGEPFFSPAKNGSETDLPKREMRTERAHREQRNGSETAHWTARNKEEQGTSIQPESENVEQHTESGESAPRLRRIQLCNKHCRRGSL